MATSGLASSKNALIFAGSVIVCAALMAGSLGKKFTPDPETEEVAQSEVRSEEPPSEAPEADESGYESDDAVFEDYGGEFSDSDLIDDTSGFDTTPTEAFEEPDEYYESEEVSRPQSTIPASRSRRAPAPISKNVNASKSLLEARNRMRARRPVSDGDPR